MVRKEINIIKRENRQMNNQTTLHLSKFSLKSILDMGSHLGLWQPMSIGLNRIQCRLKILLRGGQRKSQISKRQD